MNDSDYDGEDIFDPDQASINTQLLCDFKNLETTHWAVHKVAQLLVTFLAWSTSQTSVLLQIVIYSTPMRRLTQSSMFVLLELRNPGSTNSGQNFKEDLVWCNNVLENS